MMAHPTLNDTELIDLLQESDEKAFTEIYNRYWDKLFAIAANKLNSLTEAEELVQDIFLDLWNRRAVLTISSSLAAYLATAVKYKVINVMAHRQQQLRYVQYATASSQLADRYTEQWLSFEELSVRLHQLVTELPEKCQLVFQLSRERGLSQKQIATTLGIAEKTVEAHLTKALRFLRTALGQLFFLFFFLLID